MTGYRPIREAQDMPEGTVADLLMNDGKVVRATWCARAGTFGNCLGNKGERIPSAMVAWWPHKGKWRGRDMIGLYEPISFKVLTP